MTDEFAKGLGILMVGAMGWMVTGGWYKTESFESQHQLFDPAPQNPDMYGQLSLVLYDAFLVFAISGVITFWFLIPAYREAREYVAERDASS